MPELRGIIKDLNLKCPSISLSLQTAGAAGSVAFFGENAPTPLSD